MKVKELIEELNQFDENLDVSFQENIEDERAVIVSDVDGVLCARNENGETERVVLCSINLLAAIGIDYLEREVNKWENYMN